MQSYIYKVDGPRSNIFLMFHSDESVHIDSTEGHVCDGPRNIDTESVCGRFKPGKEAPRAVAYKFNE